MNIRRYSLKHLSSTPDLESENNLPIRQHNNNNDNNIPSLINLTEISSSSIDAEYNNSVPVKPFDKIITFVREKKLFTKENLVKLGLNVALSYGFVSNLSSITLVIISWIIFGKTAKISPLAPGQWRGFLAVYAGLWAVNNFLRPFRISLAILISPVFEKFIDLVEKRSGFRRSIAIGIVVALVNVLGSFTYLFVGLSIATSIARVPLLHKI
jgi:hypothetical protein